MHFDLIDMQLVVNIAEANSITRGAGRTHLSLPAASTRVKNLEAQFGSQLLYRTNKGVVLTPSGEAFVRHARSILARAQEMRGDMRDYGRGMKGHIRLFANTTAMTEYMPEALREFLRTHPGVDVQLRERLSHPIARAVAEGSADIGIVAGRPQVGEVQYLPYRPNRLVLVTARDHPLVQAGPLSFADTLDHDYVGLSEWSAIHPFLLQAANALGRPLRFRVEVASFETVGRMIEAGVGIGVVPEVVARRLQGTMNIALVPLADAWAERMLHVCVRELESLPAFARELVELLVQDAPAAEGP